MVKALLTDYKRVHSDLQRFGFQNRGLDKNQFNSPISYSKQFLNDRTKGRQTKSFNILTVSVGLARRLTVPDDFFVLSQSLSYQHYDLNNYNTGLFTFGNGASRNLAYTIGLSRSNKV
jgi:outer membrane protein insertion porin family